MADQSIITTSREKSHLILTDLFKEQFGDLSNFDKTSLNAWIIERITDIQRDLAVTMTLEKEEQFLNTCKNISTARKIGYNYGFDDLNVAAAKGEIIFTIELPDKFINSSIYLNADDIQILAGDIRYMFPGDIEITSNEKGTVQAVRRTNHIFDTTDNIILNSLTTYSNNKLYISFLTEVIQLDYEESRFLVSDHVDMTQSVNTIEFQDNFYRLDLWFEYYDSSTSIKSKKTLLSVEEFDGFNSNSDIYRREIVDTNKLKIILGDGINGRFYPSGKEMNYRIYTTKGADGNTINPYLNVGLPNELMDVSVFAEFTSSPTGGKNEYSLLELKDAIRKKIQTPDTIITETDLKNKLSDIMNLSSEETFHKLRRNDPIERILEMFIIVKDRSTSGSETVIPTNTLDIELNLDSVIDNSYNTIKPFFIVESSVNQENKNERYNKIIPSYRSRLANAMYYSSFYAIKIQKNPLLINFFNLNTNYQLSYENTYSNKEYSEEVYINSLSLERDIFNTVKQYKFRMTLDSLNSTFLENNTLIIKARFYNNSDEPGCEDFIIDFERAKNEKGELENNIYEAKITSLDVISDNNNLFIKDVYKKEQEFTDGTQRWAINTLDYSSEVMDNVKCEIGIFYNFDMDTVVNSEAFKDIRGVRNKLLMSSYVIEDINLYQNVDEIIYCQSEYKEGDKSTIKIKAVPLFKESYLLDPKNKDVLLNQMNSEKLLKNKITDKTEFPSRLSLKYFNTYGYSDIYSSLDNVSLSFKFEISFKNNKNIPNSELLEIKNNIIKLIDDINKKDNNEDKNIYLSDLTNIINSNSNIVQSRVLEYTDNIYFNKSALNNSSYIPSSLQLDSSNITFVIKNI